MDDWEWSYAGVSFGAATGVDVVEVEGWLNLPDVRVGDAPRARRHGMYPGRDLAGGRTVRFRLAATAETAEALEQLVADLEAVTVFQEVELPLVGQLPGRGARQLWCRPRRRDHPIRWSSVLGADVLDLEFFGSDPRIWAAEVSSVSTGLSIAVGGLSFPASAPFVFGSGGAGSVMSCPNAGTFPAGWVATFTGPLVAPGLEHVESGRTVSLSGASLGAGEQLVVDSESRTVLLEGTASRYSWLDPLSRWFDLGPGANSVRLVGASGDGWVSMSWRSAWL